MSVPCVLRRISTGQILNYNAIYPRQDPNEDVVGLDPDLEYLIKYTPYGTPDYDARIYLLTITEGPGSGVNEYHPIYTSRKQWRIEYENVIKTKDELKIAVCNAENLANVGVFPIEKQLKYISCLLATLNRKIDGQTLLPMEIELINKNNAKAVKIWQNYQNANAKISLIDTDGIPDMDEGWENVDPETEA